MHFFHFLCRAWHDVASNGFAIYDKANGVTRPLADNFDVQAVPEGAFAETEEAEAPAKAENPEEGEIEAAAAEEALPQ